MGNVLPCAKKVLLFRSIGNAWMVGRVDRPGMAFEHPTLPDGSAGRDDDSGARPNIVSVGYKKETAGCACQGRLREDARHCSG